MQSLLEQFSVGLFSLAVSLSFPLESGRFTGDFTLDLTPVFVLEAPGAAFGATATVLPGMVLLDSDGVDFWGRLGVPRSHVNRHEQMHVEQQMALGPAFWAAYALSGGRAFEPEYRLLAAPGDDGDRDRRRWAEQDYRAMWMPEPHERGRYPLLRLSAAGDALTLRLLPGYPQIARFGLGTAH